MPEFFDDSDMKIVGQPRQNAPETDFQGLLEESSRQHFNGNVAKAKTLGTNIVSSFSYRAAPEELLQVIRQAGVKPTDEVLQQVRYLSVFSAEVSLQQYLPSRMLSEIAKTEMFDVLMKFAPSFYDALARSGAFSFYYMTAQEGVVSAENVGRQFAVLCGRAGDPDYAALGKTLHELNMAAYGKAIRGFVFA